jgi:hypothetical protein
MDNYYSSLNDWIDLFGTENKTGQQGTIYKHEADNIHKKLSLKNYEADYRVVLIWMPERMNLEASNKLLKLLEEPPKGTIFILVSDNANQLLLTIISRLQTIKVSDFTTKDIINHFGENILSFEKAKQLRNLTDADFGKISQILKCQNCHTTQQLYHIYIETNSTNLYTSQPANLYTSQPANQPSSQPTSQPANQPASQPTSQPANQPANPANPATQPPNPANPASLPQEGGGVFHMQGNGKKWGGSHVFPRSSQSIVFYGVCEGASSNVFYGVCFKNLRKTS